MRPPGCQVRASACIRLSKHQWARPIPNRAASAPEGGAQVRPRARVAALIFGPRTIIPAAAVLWSLVVAAPGVVSGFWQLFVVRLLFGLVQAPAYPNLGKVTKSWFPLSIRTSLQGIVASFSGRAGAACASLFVASLLIGRVGMS